MCDSLVRLTDDGVLVAANAGGAPDDAQVLRWYPAADHDDGSTVTATAGEVPQVRRTHAVLLSHPWWAWGAEAGANEHGVVVLRTPVASRGAGAPDRGGELCGQDLLRLALERGADRRGAVEALVTLLERHGQGAAPDRAGPADSSFVVADPTGATVVETAGRAHATEEVERTWALAGGLTIPSFAAAHADRRGERRGWVVDRRERGLAHAEAATGPDGLAAGLRDHGARARGLAPHYRRRAGAVTGACMHAGGLLASTQTVSSWVGDLRGGPSGAVHWVTGTAAPCTSLLVPLRVDAPVPLDPVDPAPGRAFDPSYLWWRHERLHRVALRDPQRALPIVAAVRDRLEADWHAAPPPTEEALALADAWRDDLADHLAALSELELADVRPVRVAAQWRRWNRDAGLAL